MEKTKYYRVEIPGMTYNENYKLELPNVIEHRNFAKNQNQEKVKYLSTPLYAKKVDNNLYDLLTEDLIRTDSLSKKTICNEPELVAINIEEVSANEVIGALIQLTKEDMMRYKQQLENLKRVCFEVYRKDSREIKEYTEIQEYGYNLFKDIIEEYKKELTEETNKKLI